jgi:hypothetical protein
MNEKLENSTLMNQIMLGIGLVCEVMVVPLLNVRQLLFSAQMAM